MVIFIIYRGLLWALKLPLVNPDQAPVSRHDVRHVVVLLAGSRTGSSFLFRALHSLGAFLSPTGEETPLLRKAGIGWVRHESESDEIVQAPEAAILDKAGNFLMRDLGLRSDSGFSPETFAGSCQERAGWQFPGPSIADAGQSERAWLREKLSALPAGFHDWRGMYFEWLRRLEKRGAVIHWELFETAGKHPSQPPLVEEPPYVVPEPCQPLTIGQLATIPLLLKTSTHSYRIPLLRALYPQASFRWIVLHRNPAATISALMDGWLSSAFHSHDLGSVRKLAIAGYSEHIPGGDRFWKFDLPPGWAAYSAASLTEVAGFQWSSAAGAIEVHARTTTDPVLRFRYEDLLGGPEQAIARALEFAGAEKKRGAHWSAGDRVATVSEPRAQKWKKREREILGLLESSEGAGILRLASTLGYDASRIGAWA